MKINKFSILLLGLFCGACSFTNKKTEFGIMPAENSSSSVSVKKELINKENKVNEVDDNLPLNASFFQFLDAYENMYKNIEIVESSNNKIYGGVLPHHLFVGREFAKYFTFLQNQNPEVVVIIGPNHFEAGQGSITTTLNSFYTPYDKLNINKNLVNEINKYPIIKIDNTPFANEHSISSETAFIKKTFPNTTILPIILKSNVSEDDADFLGQLLVKILPANSLVLASVDFSHYQPEIVADLHDKTSLSTIANFDFANIYNLEIDSPASIYALLTYLKHKNAQNIVYQAHTNTASFSGNLAMAETTSHYFLGFTNGGAKKQLGTSFLFFGDTLFDRGIEEIIGYKGNEYFLANLKGEENRFFRGNHFNILNLEGPITSYQACKKGELVFNHNQELAIDHLKQGLFNMVNIANNHINDHCQEGAMETKTILETNNIANFGEVDACTTKIVNGFKTAFCGYDDTFNSDKRLEEFLNTVKEFDKNNDKMVVSVHWGWEYYTSSNDRQKELAHKLIDNGADIIIGHHPHVVQEMEIYNNKPIIYSLGNFIFDQDTSETSFRLAIGVFLEEAKTNIYLYPFKTIRFQPQLLPYEEKIEFCNKYLEKIKDQIPDNLAVNCY